MMTITILGANGQTGVELVKQSLAAGHSVIGVVREIKSDLSNPNLKFVQGDATNESVITEASQNSDVIVSVLGGMDSTLMTNAINAVIESTSKTGVKRFIVMSSFAVKQDQLSTIARTMTKSMMGKFIDDKSNSESILKKSNLDWTIVYATLLSNDEDKDGVRIVPENEEVGMKNKISRAAVAAFILKEIEQSKYIKSEVLITQQ